MQESATPLGSWVPALVPGSPGVDPGLISGAPPGLPYNEVMKRRTKALLGLIFTLPLAAFVGQCLFVSKVIDPGWGPHGDRPWSQPHWLARYGLSDAAVWDFPSRLAMALAIVGLAILIASFMRRNALFAFAGALCVVALPLLWLHFMIVSF